MPCISMIVCCYVYVDYQRFLQRFLNLHSLLATPESAKSSSNMQQIEPVSLSSTATSPTMLALQDSVRSTLFAYPIWSVRLMLTHAYITAFCPPYAMLCYAPYPPTEFIQTAILNMVGATDIGLISGISGTPLSQRDQSATQAHVLILNIR